MSTSSWISEFLYIDAEIDCQKGDLSLYRKKINEVVDRDPLKIKLLLNPNLPPESRKVVEKFLHIFQDQTRENVNKWLEEASMLFSAEDDTKYQEGIRLLQNVQSELYHAGMLEEKIPELTINGKSIQLWNINPRLLNDVGVCAVWIKPCSFRLGVESAAQEHIKKFGSILWNYKINPTLAIDNLSGYVPILASHPYAKSKNNFNTYDGPMNILLVKGDVQNISCSKKEFRKQWGRLLKHKPNTKLSWWNEKKIEWSEHLTNYIHSTDSAAETNLHLLLAYPHLSLVNRWNYPHPNL